jgi:hypothetical protein
MARKRKGEIKKGKNVQIQKRRREDEESRKAEQKNDMGSVVRSKLSLTRIF